MNRRMRYDKLNKNLQSVRASNRHSSHLNCIRINNPHQILHALGIIFRCLEHLKDGRVFLTEPIFNNGTRADILLPLLGQIEEIMVSETKERFEKKASLYPFKVVPVKVTKESLEAQFKVLLRNC